MRCMVTRAQAQGPGEAVEINAEAERADGHDWRAAGEAWGHRAADWACLYEHYAIDVLIAIFERVGLGPGASLLDVACGSGLAVRLAAAMGATVSGVDASAELLAVAAARTPDADLRLGSMFELPWPDASFDAAISINGIWGGCENALDEVSRVLKPGAPLGISFWGEGPPLDIRSIFRPLARHSPEAHHGSMKRLNDIATPGVAEAMLAGAGFLDSERGARVSIVEWPDSDVAWRAVSSIGPSVPALRGPEADAVRREIMDALEAIRDERGIYRLRSDHQFVIGWKC